MGERDFMAAVVRLARLSGWRVYHPFDSRRSEPGWPDLFMVRGARAIAAELKTARGKVTPAQHDWLGALESVPGIEAVVWRPADWPSIEAALRRHGAPLAGAGEAPPTTARK